MNNMKLEGTSKTNNLDENDILNEDNFNMSNMTNMISISNIPNMYMPNMGGIPNIISLNTDVLLGENKEEEIENKKR